MTGLPASSPSHVTVLYNTDYDQELIAAVDVSAVRESALAIERAIAEYGHRSQLIGVHGRDLTQVVDDLRAQPPDLVFNLCESLCGDVRNEPIVPAMLEMLAIPYTGSNALSLGLCLHKDRCKDILHARGIDTPAHVCLQTPDELQDLSLDQLQYPYFLKLAHEDASIGIDERNRVDSWQALRQRAGQLMARYRQPVIAERYIAGREVNVTVMGNGDDLIVLPLHEIDFSAMPAGRPHIVSYAAKWDEDHVDYAGTKPVPMTDVSTALQERIESVAKAAYRAMGLRDFGRIDMRIDTDDRPWVIDVNPNCDLSPDAGVARAAAHAGLDYPQLIGRVCELALARYEDT